jgi:outer membrane protein assembly factor BamE (lipoprotein component of BamABCDE complex)|tara:strand:- start:587 stop:1045 length:459 start_codon:yes stop_codon:yes gene_type:complete
MHKIIIILTFLLLSNCNRNPVINTHGVPFLDIKQKNLIIQETNKNDVKKVLGHPSTVAIFDNSIWIYIERTRTRGKLLKFGQNITSKNNVLALEFNEYGILIRKNFYNKSQINKINFTKDTTATVSRESKFIYNFLSSLRQKINKPAHKKKN